MSNIGLVLAGGGAKGAYQIGVWKALEEFGITKDISVVSGTSVGALNATLFAQGDIEVAINLWSNLDKDFIKINKILELDDLLQMNIPLLIPIAKSALSYALSPALGVANRVRKNGVLSKDSLLNVLNNNISIEAIKNSGVKLVVTATSFGLGHSFCQNTLFSCDNFTSKQMLTQWLLASSAFPVAYNAVKIDGKYYLDGGITNNVPVNVMNEENVKRVIVIHCSQDDDSKVKNLSPTKELFLDIKPSINTGNIISGTLNFDNKKLRKLINCGYRDTINELYTLKNEDYFTKKEISKKVDQVNKDILKEYKDKKVIEVRGKNANTIYIAKKVYDSKLKYVLLAYIGSLILFPVAAPIESVVVAPALISGFGSFATLISFTKLAQFLSPKGMKELIHYKVKSYDKERKVLVLSKD